MQGMLLRDEGDNKTNQAIPDIIYLCQDVPLWNSLANKANHILSLAEHVHRIRCEGELDAQVTYEHLMFQYAEIIDQLISLWPRYLLMLRFKAVEEIARLENEIDWAWGIGDSLPGKFTSQMLKEFEENLGRHIRLVDQAIILGYRRDLWEQRRVMEEQHQ